MYLSVAICDIWFSEGDDIELHGSGDSPLHSMLLFFPSSSFKYRALAVTSTHQHLVKTYSSSELLVWLSAS